MNNETKAALIRDLTEAGDANILFRRMKELERGRNEGAFTESEEIEHLASTLRRLRAITQNQPTQARRAIFDFLLPLGIRNSDEFTTNVTLYSSRELLANWLNEVPEAWHKSLLEECAIWLADRLEESASDPVYWTISDIGYRTPRIVRLLERIIESKPDDPSDSALPTRIDLGDYSPYYERLLELAHHRARIKLTSRVAYAMGCLADVRSLEVLTEIVGEITAEENEAIQAVLSVVPRIAQKAADQASRDQAAELLIALDRRLGSSFRGQLVIRGDVLPKCDSSRVTGFLCRVLGEGVGNENPAMSIHSLVLRRMAECYLPSQLEGITELKVPEQALANLHKYLLSDDGYDGRAATPLSDLKSMAVTGLLRLGRAELLDWFSGILDSERRDFTAHDFVNTMSVLRFDDLPSQIAQFITEEVNFRKEEESKLFLRLSAFRLARSSASEDAFAKLLAPGLRYNGSIMFDTVEALADVALYRARSDGQQATVLHELFQRISPEVSDVVRSSASRAVNALALSDLLRPQDSAFIASYLLSQPVGDDNYVHSQLVQALGCLPPRSIPPQLIDKMSEWGRQRDDWLGWRSIETLLKWDLLEERGWIRERLGLQFSSRHWQWNPQSAQINWASSFVMLLYSKSRAAFADAAATTLLDSNWEASERAALALSNICRKTQPAQEAVIGNALVTRAKTRNRPNSSDLSVFWYLAQIAPSALGAENWAEVWPNWTSEARAALADSFRTGPAAENRIPSALATLRKLLDDPHFGVRRAASRSLGFLNPSLLASQFIERASSAQKNERIRAAEYITYLDDSELNSPPIHALANDPVKSVREAAEQANGERSRAQLAKQYLNKVVPLADPSNRETLSLLRYVQSLAEVGDDCTLADLTEHLQTAEMASRIRHLKTWLYDELQKEWRKKRDKWPQPLTLLHGTMVTGQGVLRINDTSLTGEYRIWTLARDMRGQHFHWGGELFVSDRQPNDSMLGQRAHFTLEDGREGEVYIDETLHQTGSPSRITFSGVNEFPATA